MTLPSAGTQNQWGFFYSSNIPVNDPSNPPEPAPAVNVAQTVPSPSTWEFANSEMAVEYERSNIIAAQQDQTADPSPQTAVTPGAAPLGSSVGGKIPVLETIPSAPSGSFEMFGTPAIANTLAISESFAGVSPAEIAVFNFGATGNI
jgi:hypothetical protein